MSSAPGARRPWPLEIRVAHDRRSLTVRYDDGRDIVLAAEYLRVESPSAEVQGHGPGERRIPAGKRDVEILRVDPVGNYAVKLVFDDLHETGIYGWDFLRCLADEEAERWSRYLADLAARGASREPLRAPSG